MNGKGEYYDFKCHTLLSKFGADQHRKKGCDVDIHPQSYYEEMEHAAALEKMAKEVQP